MRLEQTKNAKRNIVFGMLNKVVTLILPFIARTIIIKLLGSEYLGLSNLFTSILQVLNLSELGFSSAVVYSMYKPIAEEDTDAICALLNFYKKVYRFIGIAILTVGLLLMPFLPKLISGQIPNGLNIYVLYLIYLSNTVVSYLLFSYKTSLLNAFQRTDIISNTLTITQVGMYCSQIVLLLMFHNYYTYIVMMPIFTIIANIMNSVKIDKLFPEYKCRGKIKEREFSSIKRQVPGLMINKLCYISRNSFDSIFISAFLGLITSAIYGNYYYIMNAIVGILTVISSALVAGVGNSQVLDSPESNYATMNKLNFVYMWLAGWCTICLLCLYQPFMRLWTGPDLMFENSTMVLFCVYFYALEMGVIRGVYSDASGLWWQNRYRAIIESIANIILNYVMVRIWGINGIILATLISLLIINFGWGSQIVFKYYFKNNKQKEYFVTHAKYAAVTAVNAVLCYKMCLLIADKGMLSLMLKAVICILLPNIIYFLIYRPTKEYKKTAPWILDKMNNRARNHAK